MRHSFFDFSSLDTAPAEAASPPEDRILDGNPVAEVRMLLDAENGQLAAGIWTCTPGRWRIVYDEYEYCRILSGEGEIIDENGHVRKISAGDEFILAAGFTGEWSVTKTMTKHFMVFVAS